ncbi:YicC family protein [candidate division KSB1 bacterium]|nr:YicC family protein [candidate division KSB1 bacterium]NIR72267.1 YicC family protein [candidate division KSB1 bacterium]NIS24238.1 YicC family protein [candidate division KSB1 bacterium]NIT71152.1 YicC family protein [candidate division KSB1 bacterium]NIU24857.1 YicC family protein [candidate division KSB1 bacterium]
MIASMTGFGRGEFQQNGLEVLVEIRSLNHRFLDVEIRAPKNVSAFEQEIKELIRSRILRGRISATITLKGEQEPTDGLAIDKPLASTYLRLLQELKDELGVEGSIRLEQLLTFPDIITFENSSQTKENIWEPVKKTLELALDDLKEMRLREGLEIRNDLVERIEAIDGFIREIEKISKTKAATMFEKLKERVEGLTKSEQLDDGRLEMEVALLADKVDVTEECIRFKSHNTLFLELLENGTSEGRKLNFLLQEMHREANTIGAKANDAQIAHSVVQVKEEVEKLREQIQNIE